MKIVFTPCMSSMLIAASLQGQSSQVIELPEEVRDQLSLNAQSFGPVGLTYTETVQSDLSNNIVMEKLELPVSVADTFFSRSDNRLAYQNSMIYRSHVNTRDGGASSSANEYAFDGNTVYIGDPSSPGSTGDHTPVLSKYSTSVLAQKRAKGKFIDVGYFDAIGVRLPQTNGELAEGVLPQSEVLHHIENGSSIERFEQNVRLYERDLVRIDLAVKNTERLKVVDIDLPELEAELRSNTRNSEEAIQAEIKGIRRLQELPETKTLSFYLDPKLGYAMIRRDEVSQSGELMSQTINDQFQMLGDRGVWLPRRSVTDYHTHASIAGIYSHDPIFSKVRSVGGLTSEAFPESLFTLSYAGAGTIIVDKTTTAEGITFIIPAEVDDLDAALDQISTGSRDFGSTNGDDTNYKEIDDHKLLAEDLSSDSKETSNFILIAINLVVFIFLLGGVAIVIVRKAGK